MSSDPSVFRCGHVALVGRPNTGKSTLLNRLVGQSLSITADRAQTTRHQILGVLSRPDAQLVLIDSPGYQTRRMNPLNKILNRTAQSVAQQADVVVMVTEAGRWQQADEQVLALIPKGTPVIVALNKIDRLDSVNEALPLIASLHEKHPGLAAIVPLSAKNGQGVETLIDAVVGKLPEAEAIYDEDMLTDRSERFFAAEIIREKIFRLLGLELPYESTVLIDRFEMKEEVRHIAATIIVERRAHKPIILGKGGERIKRIASEARQDMERMFDGKVFLTLWVQVRSGWAKDSAHLRTYGYE
ncbi:MAG: GTPase Era [Lautropia sp.]|nr:GTPase Era [Lautropia sp.]